MNGRGGPGRAERARRERGRGERILPGLWRLRLPLPWPGVPHCNAWAMAAGAGIVLIDTGAHVPGSLLQLERALDHAGSTLEDVQLVACTHAHADHWGQAGPICNRAGCELWMHPNHSHAVEALSDPEGAVARRLEVARQSGVSEAVLRRYAGQIREPPSGVAELIEPDRDLVAGVEIATDLGTWTVYETPGHAPSHVCLFQPERRLLLSGDHLLGRISLYYDYGWTPDPVGEFGNSLDVVDRLGARLCLAGHGRPFVDVRRHLEGNRALVRERLAAVAAALSEKPRTAVEMVPEVYREPLTPVNAAWLLTQTLCYLRHLELAGTVTRVPGSPAHRWRRA
ncbi:MAG: MBL fold metallo-hydrolase [Solirubrobacterales bacterium]|nr:MBL fold metallo-hydrolase [Solirubrobacterales bacterium]